jgi:hypothetical protein
MNKLRKMKYAEVFPEMLRLADGNPGAMVFLMELMADKNLIHAIPIASKITTCPTLKGTNLYVLYSDLGNKDFALICNICLKVPDNVLEDACSRQDYSGIDLIKPYL